MVLLLILALSAISSVDRQFIDDRQPANAAVPICLFISDCRESLLSECYWRLSDTRLLPNWDGDCLFSHDRLVGALSHA